MKVAMATHRNTPDAEKASVWPSFVREVSGSGLPLVNYWFPERSGDPDDDYQLGRAHFREAVAFSLLPHAQTLLSHVLMGMFRNIGPMETGFIEATLAVAQFGSVPPRLTDEEVAAIEAWPENRLKLRRVEDELLSAVASRKWLPDFVYLTVLRILSGAEGEFIGGAVTMIARMALNGSRH